MHMCLRVAVLLVISLLAWPTDALACSCELQPKDLHEALKAARKKADAIFRGRVVGIEPEYAAPDSKRLRLHRVAFEVTETFKGRVAPRQVVTTYRPDGIGCGYLFEEGIEYLVYAGTGAPAGLETSMCSRTQPADEARIELDSLRSGALPSRPVALRRKLVSCTECDVHTVAQALVCGGAESCELSASPKEAAAALREGRPFWSFERRESSSVSKVYGVASDGRAFKLEQRPHYAAEEKCMQRVHRRWCERLSVTPDAHGGRPDVACIGPASDELLCDETTTRRSSWGPVESPLRADCEWTRVDSARCALDAEPAPLAPGGQATRPGMVCTPEYLSPEYQCRIVPDAALEPPEDVSP
ncbi:hypothetical protein ACN28E_35065 [Archangium lansingense]|uniref:hypothetical protein n=1 Tax=Archangium lansingense TaxID=2995310 RepID=UPI003B7603E1